MVRKKWPEDERADPKDKIEIANMMHRADVLQQDTHSDEAIALLEQLMDHDPDMALYAKLDAKLGDWLVQKKDYKKAVPFLRKALQRDPDSHWNLVLLAKSLVALDDYAAAVPQLEKLIAKVPNSLEGQSYLELAYARTNRLSDAIRECKTMLQYVPDDYGSYLILGQSLARSGDPDAGVATLKEAVSLQPKFHWRISGWPTFTIS